MAAHLLVQQADRVMDKHHRAMARHPVGTAADTALLCLNTLSKEEATDVEGLFPSVLVCNSNKRDNRACRRHLITSTRRHLRPVNKDVGREHHTRDRHFDARGREQVVKAW
jgi:hypothetical protein